MKQHFLQSTVWEEFQHALGNETIRRDGEGWSYLAIVEHAGGLTRLYCPYGPTAMSLENLDKALESLKTEAKKLGVAFLRVQPYPMLLTGNDTDNRGMRGIRYSQPEATRVIDLSPSLEEIISSMSQSKRSVIRNYQNKGLTYRMSKDSSDIEALLPLLHDIAERNRILVHDDDYIRTQAKTLIPEHGSLHFIDLDGTAISGAFTFEDATTVYYAHAGTAAEHYKLQANTALVGELIAYAKNLGKTTFDLYGVAPNDDPNHPWSGVTGFKAGFGGEMVLYNQTYDIPLQKVRYHLYEAFRSVKKFVRK
jgi:lipid II:glycine glycyltransferase (peptidoglycan interpeptide bridge formation enzyme)